MKLSFSIVLTFLILLVSACGQSEKAESKVPNFPKRIGFVNDFDNLFSDKEEKILDSLIKNFKTRTATEISIVTIDSSMTTLEGFNSYTLRLANAWGVGSKKKNGILIGISASLQRVRINRGLGVGKVLTDMKTKKILDESMFPELRKGNYFEGTKIAIMELVKILDK